MLAALCLLLLVQSLTPAIATPSLNDVITARDVERLSQLFRKATLSDLATAHSVAVGLRLVAKESEDIKAVSWELLRRAGVNEGGKEGEREREREKGVMVCAGTDPGVSVSEEVPQSRSSSRNFLCHLHCSQPRVIL